MNTAQTPPKQRFDAPTVRSMPFRMVRWVSIVLISGLLGTVSSDFHHTYVGQPIPATAMTGKYSLNYPSRSTNRRSAIHEKMNADKRTGSGMFGQERARKFYLGMSLPLGIRTGLESTHYSNPYFGPMVRVAAAFFPEFTNQYMTHFLTIGFVAGTQGRFPIGSTTGMRMNIGLGPEFGMYPGTGEGLFPRVRFITGVGICRPTYDIAIGVRRNFPFRVNPRQWLTVDFVWHL